MILFQWQFISLHILQTINLQMTLKKADCTTSKRNGRIIQRSEHVENVERNRRYVERHTELYKQRQAIVEHPYGTIKRQWGFDYIMIKRYKTRVSADVGLIFVAYNLRRLINILCANREELFCCERLGVKLPLLTRSLVRWLSA